MGVLKVSEPLFLGNEKKYLCEAIDAGEVSSSGKFVERFEEAFAKWSGNKYAVAVASGTAAIETAVWALRLKEISIPTGTIISCYLGAVRAGAKVVLHDNVRVNRENIMACHLFGDFDSSTGDKIVDDLSQFWQPIEVKDVGCYSLFANKLITSGEGGIIVTNREEVYARARYYRNLCHSGERFVHFHAGYNFRMSNIQAAVGLAQLEQIEHFTEIKQRNRDLYLKHLPPAVQSKFNVTVPWMYLVRTAQDAKWMVHKMMERGIECRRFFAPIHKQPFLADTEYAKSNFPIAEDLWEHAFYLPSGLTLTEKEVIRVCGALREIL